MVGWGGARQSGAHSVRGVGLAFSGEEDEQKVQKDRIQLKVCEPASCDVGNME